MALLLLIALAFPARAEQSAAAQQITDARLALVREQLPLALALPADVASAAKDSECPQPYKSYRAELDDFAAKVTAPMHSRSDVAQAKKEFDDAYVCAAKLARAADPEHFQETMSAKLMVAQAELSRLGPADRRQLIEQLQQERLGQARAGKTRQAALGIMSRLETTANPGQIDDLVAEVKPGAGAKRFAQDWLRNPLYASEFKPPIPPRYRQLDEKPVPSAAASAPAPVQTSALASLISQVTASYHKTVAYAEKVSAAIVNSSAARAIDARLSAAVVWAESNFHNAAKSFANCVGLGQLSNGVAEAYHVKDRQDINQNLKGTTGFLRDLIKQFATPKEQSDLQALFNDHAAAVQREIKAGKSKQQAIDDEFSRAWPTIPYGMKNAVAAYNAGPNAISRYGGWDKLPLPRGGCKHRPDGDSSYCQTEAYVPKVLKNYFTVFVETSQDPIDRRPDVFAASGGAYRPLETQSGL